MGTILLLPMLMGAGSVPRHSRYLFVWAMEAQHPNASTVDTMPNNTPSSQMMDAMRDGMGLGNDFISVFDVGPDAHPFGKLVAMLPVGAAAMAHHTNYELPRTTFYMQTIGWPIVLTSSTCAIPCILGSSVNSAM
jgi:hypothetical protein